MDRFRDVYWLANRHVGKNPTPNERKAVNAIRKVTEAHGTDKANRVCAEAMNESMRLEWAEQDGFIQVCGGHEWLVRFLGKTCICMTGDECGLLEIQELDLGPHLDHTSYWETAEGRMVIVGQPYGMSCDQMFELAAWAKRNNLGLHISGWSYYFPGRSLMIEVERSDR
jgi:hypothetical protein